MKIPNDLEQYSQRLIDFCDSLSASAYVNFHRLFLMRVVKLNPNKMMLDMYVVWLQSLLVGSRKNVAGVRKNTDVAANTGGSTNLTSLSICLQTKS